MKLLQVILVLISACLIQTASAKDSLGKYQKLSLKLSELCSTQVTERELIKTIRKAGGLRATRRPQFVKTNAINFPQHVRLKILKDGNWDLMTEECHRFPTEGRQGCERRTMGTLNSTFL